MPDQTHVLTRQQMLRLHEEITRRAAGSEPTPELMTDVFVDMFPDLPLSVLHATAESLSRP